MKSLGLSGNLRNKCRSKVKEADGYFRFDNLKCGLLTDICVRVSVCVCVCVCVCTYVNLAEECLCCINDIEHQAVACGNTALNGACS